MAQKLQVLPASTRADGGGTSKITDAWLYWREVGVETLLRIDNQGNVLRHSSGPRDLADSYRDIIVVDEGTEVEATHSIDPKPIETSGPVPTGLPAKDRRFTESPSKFKKTVLRQTERPSRD